MKNTNIINDKPSLAQLAEGLIISVAEARKKLGVDAVDMTDDEVALQVLRLNDLAKELMRYKEFAK